MTTYNVLIMGASYGSLLATKLLFGGHKITMVCLPAEQQLCRQERAVGSAQNQHVVSHKPPPPPDRGPARRDLMRAGRCRMAQPGASAKARVKTRRFRQQGWPAIRRDSSGSGAERRAPV